MTCIFAEQLKQLNQLKEAERRLALYPELLKMLKLCHHWLQGNEPGRAQAIGEVIAKAEGK